MKLSNFDSSYSLVALHSQPPVGELSPCVGEFLGPPLDSSPARNVLGAVLPIFYHSINITRVEPLMWKRFKFVSASIFAHCVFTSD